MGWMRENFSIFCIRCNVALLSHRNTEINTQPETPLKLGLCVLKTVYVCITAFKGQILKKFLFICCNVRVNFSRDL